MSERQAKRLRRAARAYIVVNRASLAKGEPVLTAAHKATETIRRAWPRLNHRARGILSSALATSPLTTVALGVSARGAR